MATTTPNFGWSVPTSTDLVKDGATAIETLGDSIDASLVDLKGGTTGQVLKKNSNSDMDFVWSADSAGMTNPMTTTGDTIYSSSGSTPARLGIGSTGQVLTVSGGVPTWATASAGANWTLLNTGGTSLSGVATVTVSGISNASQVLVIHENAASGTANSTVSLRINADTGTNYDRRVQVSTQPGTSYATSISSATAQTNDDQVFLGQQANSTGANAVINGYVLISGASTSGVKPVFMVSGGANDGSNGFQATRIGAAIYDSSSAVSSITFRTTNASNFTGGTIYVYTTA